MLFIVLMLSMVLLGMSQGRIVSNQTSSMPLLVTYGNHTTMKVHGFGKGGDSRVKVDESDDTVQESNLEMGAEWVQFDIKFYSWHDMHMIRRLHKFDLFLLENDRDYDCYKRAVKELIENNTRVHCDFLNNQNRIELDILNKTFSDIDLLNWNQVQKTYIVVVDNSPWPEALNNTQIYSQDRIDRARDQQIHDLEFMYTIQYNYNETNVYKDLIRFLSFVICLLLLILALCSYAFIQLKTKQDRKYLNRGEKKSKQRAGGKKVSNKNKRPAMEQVDVMQYQTKINDQSLLDESIDCDRIDNEYQENYMINGNSLDRSMDRSLVQEEDYS